MFWEDIILYIFVGIVLSVLFSRYVRFRNTNLYSIVAIFWPIIISTLMFIYIPCKLINFIYGKSDNNKPEKEND